MMVIGGYMLPEGIVRSLLVGPMFFLIPMGIGLGLIPHRTVLKNLGLGRLELTAVAFFTGALCLVAVFVARERGMLTLGSLDDWMWGTMVVSALGFMRLFRLGNGFPDNPEFLYVLAAALGVFAPLYFVHFGIFSKYPYTDLFQYTHLMKGANELARFDRLNPFTADSYLAIWQTTLGILKRLFEVDLLSEFWVLPWIALPFRTIIYYVLARKLFTARNERIFFVAVLIVFSGCLPPTNGDLAMLAAVLILALLLPQRDISSSLSQAFTGFAVVSVGVVGGYTLAKDTVWAVPLLVIGMAVGLGGLSTSYQNGCQLVVLLQAALAIAPLHRSTLAFLPLVAGITIWRAIAGRWLRPCMAITWTASALVFLGGIAITAVNGVFRLSIEESYWIGPLLTQFNQSFSPVNTDAALGAGSKVALFEIARSVGAWLVLAALSPGVGMFGREGSLVQHDEGRRSMWPFGATALITLIILLGIPFVYRAGFLVVILLATVWTERVYEQRMESRFLLLLVAFMAAALAFVYGVTHLLEKALFIRWLKLYLLGVAAALIATVLLYMHRWTKHRARWMLAVMLIGALTFDRVLTKAYFMSYAYGEMVENEGSKVITHYDHADLEIAGWLQKHGGQTILVSDPITMANLRAFAGLNSIVSFSNLDTMPPSVKQRLKNLLTNGSTSLIEMVPRVSGCYDSKQFKEFMAWDGVSPEANYALFRTLNTSATGEQVLAVFDYSDGLLLRGRNRAAHGQTHEWVVKEHRDGELNLTRGATHGQTHEWMVKEHPLFTIVISSRTYKWLQTGQLRPYLNGLEPLPTDLIKRMQNQCQAFVFGERAIIVPVHANEVF
ncbi:MAG: hypothetical protein NNA23_03530 [Nitrospira sp.]|nr:hypothetical protein [Nitrospira sp.]